MNFKFKIYIYCDGAFDLFLCMLIILLSKIKLALIYENVNKSVFKELNCFSRIIKKENHFDYCLPM